jgi:hypothetical protein
VYRSPVRLTSQLTLDAGQCRRHTDLAPATFWSDFADNQVSPFGAAALLPQQLLDPLEYVSWRDHFSFTASAMG